MEKELKSCTGVLLMAEDARAGFQFFFYNVLVALLAPHIKKLETYFASLYFWTFAQCEHQTGLEVFQDKVVMTV